MDLELLRRRYQGYDWIPVTIGASAASVFRLEGPAGALYVKAATAGGVAARMWPDLPHDHEGRELIHLSTMIVRARRPE